MLNADLHCHSTVSDGMLSPAEVATRAHSQGVVLWSLTDHDEVGGIPLARETAQSLGLCFVAGVEISVTWCNKTIHIVGLNIDETNKTLLSGLCETRYGRENRALAIGLELEKVGIPGTFEGALSLAGNPSLISRTHFARYLVERRVCKDVRSVFHRYLVEGKPGYIPHQWASLESALSWIHAAGGLAVIAHPGRYHLEAPKLVALLDQFKSMGGEGIEVNTGSHTPAQYLEYGKIAKQYGLLASCGSDFHAPKESRMDLGKLPPLSHDLIPIWRDWMI